MCFISNSPGGYAMYRLNPLKFHPGLHEEVDARTDVLHMDDFLRTKISRMQRLPNISYPWCFAARAWLARAPLSFYFYFQAGARRWLKDTNCKLRMFVDPERHLYSALGLRRSLTNAWSISKLVFYAEQKRAGRRMFEEDDPNQIGGDFILDEQGRLALIHRSKIPTDKPSVEELLSCVKDLNRAKANS